MSEVPCRRHANLPASPRFFSQTRDLQIGGRSLVGRENMKEMNRPFRTGGLRHPLSFLAGHATVTSENAVSRNRLVQQFLVSPQCFAADANRQLDLRVGLREIQMPFAKLLASRLSAPLAWTDRSRKQPVPAAWTNS